MRAVGVSLVVLAAALLAAWAALAHGDAAWIMQKHSWCCGPQDCTRLDKGAVKISAEGYVVTTGGRRYVVPFGEAMVSDNEDYWLCVNLGDMSRRCFFAPPVGA